MLLGARKVVGFFAHSDDEFICAGTLHRLARKGAEIHVVTFSPAAVEGDRTGRETSLKIVTQEWHRSLDLIGVKDAHRHLLGWIPSADLASRGQDVCQYVYDFCERERPDVAMVLSPEDENTAHRVVGEQCERVMRGRVPTVVRCQYPWNYCLGRPNLFVRLSEEDLAVKRQVIDAYASQKFRYDYGNILMHAVITDGLSVKVPAAEKFELVRSVL